MSRLSKRDISISVRANEQLPLPFGPREDWNNAQTLANTNPQQYLANGYHLSSNFDTITQNMLEKVINQDEMLYRKWLMSGFFDNNKFQNLNLKYMATALEDSDNIVEFLIDDWYKMKQVTPNTPIREKIISDAATQILEDDITGFWRVADQWDIPINKELLNKGRQEALKIAKENPEAYYEEYWLNTVDKLQDITGDALDTLATRYPKKYLEMLNGNFWDDFQQEDYAFKSMANALADSDPIDFFEELYSHKDDYKEYGLTIPAKAIVAAGEWVAENNPDWYIEFGLTDAPELNEVTRKLGLAGATLPQTLSEQGYKLIVDIDEPNFVSINPSNYPNMQRHPEAAQYERFDVSINWPAGDPMRRIQNTIVNDYTSYAHEVGNPSSTKSFALVAPNVENKELLIEEIQSDFPTILHRMKNDNYRSRAEREKISEDDYNIFVKKMSEHVAAYPYLVIQRLAEFASQNDNIDMLKLSSLPAVLSFAGIDNTKKAKKIYEEIPKELGFEVNKDFVPKESIDKFIDYTKNSLSDEDSEKFQNLVKKETIGASNIEGLARLFETTHAPGAGVGLHVAAQALAQDYPDIYIKHDLHNIREFLPYTKMLDNDTYRFWNNWSTYGGNMRDLAARAAEGAKQAVERLYEKSVVKKDKPISKIDKKIRELSNIDDIRKEVSSIVGGLAETLDYSNVEAYRQSIKDLVTAKLISKKQKKQLTSLIQKYVKAFLDALITKVAYMYGENQMLSKRAKKDNSSKAGVFIVLPPDIAKQFPLLGKHDDSQPHVTTLFIGKVPKKHEKLLLDTVKNVAKDFDPFEMKLDDKVSYFPPTKHSEGCKVAKLKIISDGLHQLHKALKKSIVDAGISVDDHFPIYKPHVTLAYMEPPKKTYDRIFPSGSWVANEIHIWNGDKKNSISLGEKKSKAHTISIRAKVTSDKPAYKEKKKTDNGYVWVYDEKHVEKRWKEKKDKLKKLEKDLKKVREQYRKDLKSDDERTRAIAAIVGIMDDTAMRIGNEESAKEGTFGASTLKVKHVKGGKGKITFDFPGKGAVEQNVTLENNEVIKVVRDLMKGKKADDFIFEVDGKKIWDRAVNRYLSPMGISAKDLRGFHANRLMKEILKKKDFKEALDEVAEIVGHKASTLKNQYLDPELVEKHEKKEKKAFISIRAKQYEQIQQTELGGPELQSAPMDLPEQLESHPDKQPVDLYRNIGNIRSKLSGSGIEQVKITPQIAVAWKIIAPFLPTGAEISSGFRSEQDQANTIKNYWFEKWNGYFAKNFPDRGNDIEDMQKFMNYEYNPDDPKTPPGGPTRAEAAIAAPGESRHQFSGAMDVHNVNYAQAEKILNWINVNLGEFIKLSAFPEGDHIHIAIEDAVYPGPVNMQKFLRKFYYGTETGQIYKSQSSDTLPISKIALEAKEQKFVNYLENKYFGSSGKELSQPKPQRKPISNRGGGDLNDAKKSLGIMPGVKLTQEILSAWVALKPFLPASAKMTSAFRTPEDQVRIIDRYWKRSGLANTHSDITDPYERSRVLIQNGWIVGPPTRPGKKPIHGSGRAFDISGANLQDIAEAARQVSSNPDIPVKFSQVLIEDKNNAVHVMVKDVLSDPASMLAKMKAMQSTASAEEFLSKRAMENEQEELSSIFEDLSNSNPPKDVVEAFGLSADADDDKYEEEKDDSKWDDVLIDEDRKWTRREIRNHYEKYADKILKEIKDKPVMLFIGTGKNQNILKRNHDDKKIVIDNKDDLMYWADRRMVSIHRVFESETKLGFVDLDVHEGFSKEKALKYAKAIASKIKSKYGSSATIYESGGTGYHVEFNLGKEMKTDTLRNELRELCEELNENYEGFTTGIVKGQGVRTDTTTLKNNGNIRVPYALHEKYGGIKKSLSKSASLSRRDIVKEADVLDYPPRVYELVYNTVADITPFLVAEALLVLSRWDELPEHELERLQYEVNQLGRLLTRGFGGNMNAIVGLGTAANDMINGNPINAEFPLNLDDWKNYNEFSQEIEELRMADRYNNLVVMLKNKIGGRASASFANMPPGVGGVPFMIVYFDISNIAGQFLAGADIGQIISQYLYTVSGSIQHELVHLAQAILTDATRLRKGESIDDISQFEKPEDTKYEAGTPSYYKKERHHMYSNMPEDTPEDIFQEKYYRSDVEFFPLLRNLIIEAKDLVNDNGMYTFELSLLPPEYQGEEYRRDISGLPRELETKLRRNRLVHYINSHKVLTELKKQDTQKYNKAIRELYRYVSPGIGINAPNLASISIRDMHKQALSLEELKDAMGLGLEDEPGDWFEKSPMFRHRDEVPGYSNIDANESEASQLAHNDPEKFFYRGLHKKYPQLEAEALKNMIENNAAFYFNFKYHEREEPEFKALLESAAEALSQHDVRAFFYYHLHHTFPELGRGAIIQLIDTNPDSFFDLGLQKDYPDYEEAAGNARNIKDPHKVELEMPEWINTEPDKPISLRDRNASKISRRAGDVTTLYGIPQGIVDNLKHIPGFGVQSHDWPAYEKEEDGREFYRGSLKRPNGIEILWAYEYLPRLGINIVGPRSPEEEANPTMLNMYRVTVIMSTDKGDAELLSEIDTDPEEALGLLYYYIQDDLESDIEEVRQSVEYRELHEGPQEKSEENSAEVVPFPKKSSLKMISIRQAAGLGPIAPMKLKKMESPDAMLKDYDDSEIIIQQKIDGFKTQAIKDKGGAVKLYTRRGEGFEANVPNLAAELEDKMSSGDFWLGELAYLKDGKQSISDVQTVVGSSPENAKKKIKEKGQLVFYVYDLLWDNGKDITKNKYIDRYNKLKSKVGNSKLVQIVKNYSYADKDKAINDALKAGGEGIVLKPKNSEYKYSSKGSNEPVGEWAKHKPKGKKSNTDEVILNKYDKGKDKLIFPMYQYKDGKLFEVGKISGMSKEDEAKIKKDIDVGKSVVIEISFQERMESGKFRHPGWSRFRPDKPTKEVKVAAFGGTRKLTRFPDGSLGPEDETKPDVPHPLSSRDFEEVEGEERDYTQNPIDTSFDQGVDIRDIKPVDVVRYFLMKHYKRDKYRPYNKEMLLKLFTVQPSKFFDLELFNDPEFKDETMRAAFHAAVLEPHYFFDVVLPNFTDLASGYTSLADKSLQEGKSPAERRNELMHGEKPKKPWWKLSKRAGKLDYPKQMLEEIIAWAESVVGELKKPLFRKSKERKMSKYFKIDISDTDQYKKHDWVRSGIDTIQGNDWDRYLVVTLYSKNPYDLPGEMKGGSYMEEEGEHHIWVFDTYDQVKSGEIAETLKHELTHMMQKIMTTLTHGVGTKPGGLAGMPVPHSFETEQLYGKEEGFFGADWDEQTRLHHISDVEFFPLLNEEIHRIQDIMSRTEPKFGKMMLEHQIDQSQFLQNLKKYDNKRYNKALRELYRAFDEYTSQISQRASDPLSTYKKKRDFDETPEPEGKTERKNQHRFVIQRHKAKKAGEHFDLRLENDDGAMSSWAIPKHKLPKGKERLLAMKTEDHPISYNKFKGEIPEGEYGAGIMDIHDGGKYEEIEWSTNKIVFKLRGKREKGTYKLVKTDDKKWLIMTAEDENSKKEEK